MTISFESPNNSLTQHSHSKQDAPNSITLSSFNPKIQQLPMPPQSLPNPSLPLQDLNTKSIPSSPLIIKPPTPPITNTLQVNNVGNIVKDIQSVVKSTDLDENNLNSGGISKFNRRYSVPSEVGYKEREESKGLPRLTVITNSDSEGSSGSGSPTTIATATISHKPRSHSVSIPGLSSHPHHPQQRPRSNSKISNKMTKLRSLFLGDKTPVSGSSTPLSASIPTPNGSNVTTGTTTPHPDKNINGTPVITPVGTNTQSPSSSTVSFTNYTAGNSNSSTTNTATTTTASTSGSSGSANNTTTSTTQVARSSSISKSTTPPRFEISEDGSTHTHHLKTAKRQEKLSSMLKEFLGGKKIRDEAVSAVYSILNGQGQGHQTQAQIQTQIQNQLQAHALAQQGQGQPLSQSPPPASPSPVPSNNASAKPQPPSLMAGFVNQLKRGDKDAQSLLSSGTSTPSSSQSFIEKYGKCHEVIGKGSFGIVRVSHKIDPKNQRDQLFAVKEFKRRPQESEQKYSKRLTSEFCISSSLHHPNIIQTLDLLQDSKGDYCEVMEYCSGGDLYSLILVVGKLEYLEADCFFKQIIRGVNYMHEMGVAHRDLKPENILITTNGAIKITDFGNGECFRMAWERVIHLSNGLCGSAPYIAPEEFTDSEFDPRAVDIWAVGVIYMAMRTGRHLWRMAKPTEDEFYAKYLQGRKDENGYEPIESLKRARCRNVIYSILDPVPSRRITGKQILKSEWGREIHVCQAGELGL